MIVELENLGPFPSEKGADLVLIKRQQELLQSVVLPISNEEARKLIRLFGPDEYYGLAWTLLHLIESATDWPLADCLSDFSSEWVERLKERAARMDSKR